MHCMFSSVQLSTVAWSCLNLCNSMNHSTPGLPVQHQLLESTQTYVHWICDAIQPSQPLSSPSPPALNLSQHQGLFQWVGSSHQVARYYSFSFSISPSNEYSVFISFKIDWFDLLEVQETLKSLGVVPSPLAFARAASWQLWPELSSGTDVKSAMRLVSEPGCPQVSEQLCLGPALCHYCKVPRGVPLLLLASAFS